MLVQRWERCMELVEGVGPLQQGLRHRIRPLLERPGELVEGVGPLQQGLRPIFEVCLNSKVISCRRSRSTTTGIATSLFFIVACFLGSSKE